MRVFGGDTVFREAISTGETVEQAIQNACSELGIESCGDNFEIIEMPTKKHWVFLGAILLKLGFL